jgi:hypothetical protein
MEVEAASSVGGLEKGLRLHWVCGAFGRTNRKARN